jgi:hypothetical protein
MAATMRYERELKALAIRNDLESINQMIKQEKPLAAGGREEEDEYGREENEEEDEDEAYYEELAKLKGDLRDEDDFEEDESMLGGLGKRSLRGDDHDFLTCQEEPIHKRKKIGGSNANNNINQVPIETGLRGSLPSYYEG